MWTNILRVCSFFASLQILLDVFDKILSSVRHQLDMIKIELKNIVNICLLYILHMYKMTGSRLQIYSWFFRGGNKIKNSSFPDRSSLQYVGFISHLRLDLNVYFIYSTFRTSSSFSSFPWSCPLPRLHRNEAWGSRWTSAPPTMIVSRLLELRMSSSMMLMFSVSM